MGYIELKDVSFAYPDGHLAVDGVSMSIEKGENVAIVGQNGAGKTTTVKLFNALHYPTGGDVVINGKSTKGQTTAQVSRTVGYVFQNPDDQIFHSTVLAEVEFGPRMMKLPEEKVKELVDYALKITGMKRFREENPYNLPLSVRKFVTIAAIIAMDCDVMIFDEPTAGQDYDGNRRLSRILRELSGKGKTLITISHDMVFVADNFSRVIVMSNKKVIMDGTPKEVFWNLPVLDEAMLKQPYVSRICHSLGLSSSVTQMDEAVTLITEAYQSIKGEQQ
ncbi:Energy-coupling factor transporter ATP-binding protein EcfA3 [bioreactor metagenome]|uniref:Energy-coupling factor transporter ATP-binding protein EcfA3 n=1 Tax=bioreactor metagenome TaxID=1076179 RepID=A0A645DA42_9ZZZZ